MKAKPSRDAFGSVILVGDLPRAMKPPFVPLARWSIPHRGWNIAITRFEGDPLPHVVAAGVHPHRGRYEAHAERQVNATPATVRAWVDGLLDQTGEDLA